MVVDQPRLNVPKSTYFGSSTNDGRMIFTIPIDGKIYFGTPDTDFKSDLTHYKVEQGDVDYLSNIINKKYSEAHITLDDVKSGWVGVTPIDFRSDYLGMLKIHSNSIVTSGIY